MTYETWAREKKWAEGGAVLERDPKAYFAAPDDVITQAMELAA